MPKSLFFTTAKGNTLEVYADGTTFLGAPKQIVYLHEKQAGGESIRKVLEFWGEDDEKNPTGFINNLRREY